MSQRSKAQPLDVTTGGIWPQLLTLFIPVFLCVVLQELCAYCDLAFISQHIQARSLEAVQAVVGIPHVVISLAVGMGVGCSIIVSHHFGAQSGRRLKQTTHTAIALSIVAGVLGTTIGLPAVSPALHRLGMPNELMGEACAFAYPYLASTLLIFVFNMGSALLRAVGDVRTPINTAILLLLTNIGLDVVLVSYLDLGTHGASFATVASYLLVTTITIRSLVRTQAPWRLYPKRIRIYTPIARDMLACAVPLMLQGILFSVTNLVIQNLIAPFGAQTAEAWRISVRIGTCVWLVADAIAMATITFSAQNFGTGNYRRMKRGLHAALFLTLVLVGCVIAFICSLAPQIAALFGTDRTVTDLAASLALLTVPFYLILAWTDDIAATIRGSGEGFWPMVIIVCGTCIVRVAWIVLVVPRANSIITAVISYPVAWLVTILAFVVYYRHGQWITRSLRRARHLRADF